MGDGLKRVHMLIKGPTPAQLRLMRKLAAGSKSYDELCDAGVLGRAARSGMTRTVSALRLARWLVVSDSKYQLTTAGRQTLAGARHV